MTSGPVLRDQGVADVLAADCSVTRDYASLIRFVVDDFLIEFTAEDIRDVIADVWPDARPHSPNIYGAVFRELANAGRIRPVGWQEASRPCARGRVLRVWRAT